MLQIGSSISPDFVQHLMVLWWWEVNGGALEGNGNFIFDFHEGHFNFLECFLQICSHRSPVRT